MRLLVGLRVPVDGRDRFGRTAMAVAVQNGDSDLVDALASCGATRFVALTSEWDNEAGTNVWDVECVPRVEAVLEAPDRGFGYAGMPAVFAGMLSGGLVRLGHVCDHFSISFASR